SRRRRPYLDAAALTARPGPNCVSPGASIRHHARPMKTTSMLCGLALALCACSGPCKAVAGGGCSQDSDCVMARCTDANCDCGCGVSVAVSRVGKEHPCLVATGNSAPAGCHPTGAVCNCFANCQNVRAVCSNGQCASTGL